MSEPHLITDSPGSETTTGEPESLDDAVNPQLIEKGSSGIPVKPSISSV
jgi:hypothetical protein